MVKPGRDHQTLTEPMVRFALKARHHRKKTRFFKDHNMPTTPTAGAALALFVVVLGPAIIQVFNTLSGLG